MKSFSWSINISNHWKGNHGDTAIHSGTAHGGSTIFFRHKGAKTSSEWLHPGGRKGTRRVPAGGVTPRTQGFDFWLLNFDLLSPASRQDQQTCRKRSSNGQVLYQIPTVVFPFRSPSSFFDQVGEMSMFDIIDDTFNYIYPVSNHKWNPMRVSRLAVFKCKPPDHST